MFRDGLEPLDASRLAQGEKGRCATPAFHTNRSCRVQTAPPGPQQLVNSTGSNFLVRTVVGAQFALLEVGMAYAREFL